MIHQKTNADNLEEAEGLLKDLFMDVDKSKKLQHPQSAEIEREYVLCVWCVYVRPPDTNACQQTRLKLDMLHAIKLCHFPHSLPLLSTSTAWLLLVFAVWEIYTIAGQRTAPHSGNSITIWQIWSWNQRLTGVPFWMKSGCVGALIQTFDDPKS